MKIILSIVVPVYNTGSYIYDLLYSFNRNSYDALCSVEIIIVDDGSSDDSNLYIDKAKNDFEHLTINVITQENGGVSSARNNGLMSAKGEFVWFIDSDDMLAIQAIDFIVTRLSEINNNIDCIYTGEKIRDCLFDDNSVVDKADRLNMINSIQDVEIPSFKLLRNRCISHQTYIYRRKTILDNRLSFPLNIKYNEDMRFLFTVLVSSSNSQHLGDCRLYFSRERNDSVSKSEFTLSKYQKLIEDKVSNLAYFESIFIHLEGEKRDYAHRFISEYIIESLATIAVSSLTIVEKKSYYDKIVKNIVVKNIYLSSKYKKLLLYRIVYLLPSKFNILKRK